MVNRELPKNIINITIIIITVLSGCSTLYLQIKPLWFYSVQSLACFIGRSLLCGWHCERFTGNEECCKRSASICLHLLQLTQASELSEKICSQRETALRHHFERRIWTILIIIIILIILSQLLAPVYDTGSSPEVMTDNIMADCSYIITCSY